MQHTSVDGYRSRPFSGNRHRLTFAGPDGLSPIPGIHYSGEDLPHAIGCCYESGFQTGRTRRLGMAI